MRSRFSSNYGEKDSSCDHQVARAEPASISLEDVLETELDNARIDSCGINLPKRRIPQCSIGIPELGGVEGIVKLRPELEGMTFFYQGVLGKRDIPVKLAGTASNASSRIAPAGTITIDPTGWGLTEYSAVEKT